jgi:serine phosphatase RsbU (regulator of sigma subunit)/CHASE2 domain-containing sensor protein
MKQLLVGNRIRLVVAAVLGAGFALLAFQGNWFRSVDLKTYDLGLSVRPQLKPASDVVVVALDKYSRQKAFAPPEFPISAHVEEHARVVDRLTAAGVKAIAFDLLFDQLAPDLEISRLAASFRSSGRVCLACAVERQTLAMRSDGSAITEERLVIPSRGLVDSLYCLGLVNMPLDSDGVARRGSYGRVFQGKVLPSMPVVLAEAAGGQPRTGVRGDTEGSGDSTFYIDYRLVRSGITLIPYAEVLLGDGWQDAVRDRIVLIGVTETGLSDVYDSPIAGLAGADQDNRLAGVLVLAHATQTLMSKSLVWPLARPYGLALSIALAVAASLIALNRRLAVSVGLILGLLLLLVAAGILTSALRLSILPVGVLLSVTLFTAAIGLLAGYIQTRVMAQVQRQELEEISTDLRKAAEIQQNLQPESIPAIDGVALAGFQIPCKEIGGDYYDVIDLGCNRVGLLIADVCGKGVAAALLMSNLQSKVRQLAPTALSPKQLVIDLNKATIDVLTEGRFVTLVYGVLDRDTMEFSYCSAGHMPPLVCRANGEVAELPQGGIPIGLLPEFNWQEHGTCLFVGDVLFMYTDGLSEAGRKKTGELYGDDRIKAYLAANRGKAPGALNGDIVREAQQFSGTEHLSDDITLLTLKIGSPGA